MFETAELGRSVSKEDFQQEVLQLRPKLLLAQHALKQTASPVVVIVGGVDGAGKGDLIHRLNEWLDPRGVHTATFWQKSQEETRRPDYWRFWQTLPERGRIALFYWGWYNAPIFDRALGNLSLAKLDAEMQRVAALERMLADDESVILKFWLHLPRDIQRKRLKQSDHEPEPLSASSKLGPDKFYTRLVKAADRAIRQTDHSHAPWFPIEATDANYRDLAVARIVLEGMRAPIEKARKTKEGRKVDSQQTAKLSRQRARKLIRPTILDRVDLEQDLKRKDYEKELRKYQEELNRLTWKAYRKKKGLAIVFEGWDAAGKGGAIRRVTSAVDARLFRVNPVAAPNEEERAHHYLWRFWKKIPRAGLVTIFDRSWYGRVLVERVEGFARPEEWARAYAEINEFELQLCEADLVVAKFWLHISKEEQLKRFREREKTEHKAYKITDEDWRNREKWSDYELAVNEMVARTSTGHAKWLLLAGNSKRFARIQVLRHLCQRLEKAV